MSLFKENGRCYQLVYLAGLMKTKQLSNENIHSEISFTAIIISLTFEELSFCFN